MKLDELIFGERKKSIKYRLCGAGLEQQMPIDFYQ